MENPKEPADTQDALESPTQNKTSSHASNSNPSEPTSVASQAHDHIALKTAAATVDGKVFLTNQDVGTAPGFFEESPPLIFPLPADFIETLNASHEQYQPVSRATDISAGDADMIIEEHDQPHHQKQDHDQAESLPKSSSSKSMASVVSCYANSLSTAGGRSVPIPIPGAPAPTAAARSVRSFRPRQNGVFLNASAAAAVGLNQSTTGVTTSTAALNSGGSVQITTQGQDSQQQHPPQQQQRLTWDRLFGGTRSNQQTNSQRRQEQTEQQQQQNGGATFSLSIGPIVWTPFAFWKLWLLVQVFLLTFAFIFSTHALSKLSTSSYIYPYSYSSPSTSIFGAGNSICDPNLVPYVISHIIFDGIQIILSGCLFFTLPTDITRWTHRIYTRMNRSLFIFLGSAVILLGQLILIPVGFAIYKGALERCGSLLEVSEGSRVVGMGSSTTMATVGGGEKYVFDVMYYVLLIEVMVFTILSLPVLIVVSVVYIFYLFNSSNN
jgi:hypothetical protein